MKTIKEIIGYREMIASLVRRDLRGRYKGSVLGFFWTFLNPLLQLSVYTIVFSKIMRNGIEDYYLFLFVALIPWMFFSTSVANGCGAVTTQAGMVKKIYFPRQILPIELVTSQFVNMLFSMLVVFLILILSGKGLSLKPLMFLPVIMLIEYFLALGMALLVSSLTVYFRDLEYLMSVLILAWQFLTPVLYSIEMVPENMRTYFYINPMTSIIIAYRDILYYKRVPEMNTLILAVVVAPVFMVLGWNVFSRRQKRFAEYL